MYVKVIADYLDDNKVEYHIGEELFITGADQMIYYPRPEHALISYNGNNVYHAIAKNEGVAETINTLLRGTSLENVFDSLVKNYGRVDK